MFSEIVIFLILFVSGRCRVFEEDCPQPEVIKDVDVNKMLGVWYLQAETANSYNAGKRCIREEHVYQGDNHVNWNKKLLDVETNEETEFTIDVEYKGPEENGKLLFKIPGVPKVLTVYIVDLDYSQHFVTFTCEAVESTLKHSFYILSRERTLAPEKLEGIVQKLKRQGVDTDNIYHIDHSDCPF